MSRPRVPPLWLMLLPAFVLAAVGVRAVTAEMDASQDAARERAKSVASRLARSVDALVEEYAGALPAAGSRLTQPQIENGDYLAEHLVPHCEYWLNSVRGDLRSERADYGLARDAIETAARLGEADHGNVAAAALLRGTQEALAPGSANLVVAAEEADRLVQSGDRELAIDAVNRAYTKFMSCSSFVMFDGDPYPETALGVAARIVGAAQPPEWLVTALERCALLGPLDRAQPPVFAVFDDLDGTLAARLRPAIRLRRASAQVARTSDLQWPTTDEEVLRRAALTPRRDPIEAAKLVIDDGAPHILLWHSVDEDGSGPSRLIGGEIPESVVCERLIAEADALIAEPGVAAVRLVGDAATDDFARKSGSRSERTAVIESAQLRAPLDSWRAEAVLSLEAVIPASAWLLAAALAVTTLALVAGLLALRRSAERSARLAEDRQTFLDHVAHELRSPAAAVQALTEELASGHVTAEREPEYRAHLLRESRRLSALVEDTLDLTRLDAGRLAFRMEPTDLRDVVRRAIEDADGAGRVVARVPDAPVVRPVDEGTLRRAVKNLVENAVRHGGGDAPVVVALEASNGEASIAVTDQGRGIAAEHLPRLFERFYRVPSLTHETKGVGLGLALCREVARAHGGDVDVESRVGKGSTFTLRIPLA